MTPRLIDISGNRYGRLVAVSRVKNKDWMFKCDCGKAHVAKKDNVIGGRTTSCGCFHNDDLRARNHKHGHARHDYETKTYRCWKSMIQRTTNPTNSHWKYYGARGITVCDRWRHSYEYFLSDMGESPPGLTIDRIDNDRGYEPGNCRWADYSTQNNNKRRKAA